MYFSKYSALNTCTCTSAWRAATRNGGLAHWKGARLPASEAVFAKDLTADCESALAKTTTHVLICFFAALLSFTCAFGLLHVISMHNMYVEGLRVQ